MKRTAELLLAVFVSGLLAFQIGSCGRDPVADTRQDAYETERILRQNRNVLHHAQSKTDTVTRTVIRADARLLAERDSLMSVLAYAEDVLADSGASLVTLRVTLAVTVSRAREYQEAVDSLQGHTRELIAAHALERLATNKTLAAADSSIKAWKANADAERRKGWRRFTQGAFVGGIVALVLVVAL